MKIGSILREIKWFYYGLKNSSIYIFRNTWLKKKVGRQANIITKLELSRKALKNENKELREGIDMLRGMYSHCVHDWEWERKRYYNLCGYIEDLFEGGEIDSFIRNYDYEEENFYLYVMRIMKKEGRWIEHD